MDTIAGAVGAEAREKILSRNGKLTSGEVTKLADIAKQDRQRGGASGQEKMVITQPETA